MRTKKVMAIENLEEAEANFILFPVSGYKNGRTLIKNYGENPPARKEIINPLINDNTVGVTIKVRIVVSFRACLPKGGLDTESRIKCWLLDSGSSLRSTGMTIRCNKKTGWFYPPGSYKNFFAIIIFSFSD
jgi:hypothetical protein